MESVDTDVAPSNTALNWSPSNPMKRGDLGIGNPVKICVVICGQNVTDSGMVTMDSL